MIVFDDFRDDTAATYRATLRFLGVDPDFEPEYDDGEREPPGSRIRAIGTLHSKSYLPPTGIVGLMRRAARVAIPSQQRESADSHRQHRASEYRLRAPAAYCEPSSGSALKLELADEVRELGELHRPGPEPLGTAGRHRGRPRGVCQRARSGVGR